MNYIPILLIPTITLPMWTKGYQDSLDKINVTVWKPPNTSRFFMRFISKEYQTAAAAAESAYNCYIKLSRDTFDKYTALMNSVRVLTPHNDFEGTVDFYHYPDFYKCSCAINAKQFIFSCAITLGLKRRQTKKGIMKTINTAAMTCPLGRRRGPGRPALAKSAWVYDEYVPTFSTAANHTDTATSWTATPIAGSLHVSNSIEDTPTFLSYDSDSDSEDTVISSTYIADDVAHSNSISSACITSNLHHGITSPTSAPTDIVSSAKSTVSSSAAASAAAKFQSRISTILALGPADNYIPCEFFICGIYLC